MTASRWTSLVEAYRRDGWALLPAAVAQARVDDLRDASFAVWERALADPACRDRLFSRLDDAGQRVPDRIDPYFDLDPSLGAFAMSAAMTEPTGAVLGGEPWVLKDKLICKPPGVDGYGPHQDHAYYLDTGVPADRLVSVVVPLAAFSGDAGPTEVVTGSHHELLTAPGTFDPAPEELADRVWVPVIAEPGDLVFLHPLTLHRAAPNRSRQGRPAVFITYGTGPGGADAAKALRATYRAGAKATIDRGGSGVLPDAPDERASRMEGERPAGSS